MKKIFIVANWKSNMLSHNIEKWFEDETSIGEFMNRAFILRDKSNVDNDKKQRLIIVCPPFVFLEKVKILIENKGLDFKIGTQNISPFVAGAYTGEVNAEQIREFAEFVIIGHSERRGEFGETDEIVAKKVKQCLDTDLAPIFCIQNASTPVPEGVKIVAYEPVGAIGTGKPDTPESAEKVAKEIKNKYEKIEYVLYGGSVNSENVKNFTEMENINGVLVGGASLDPVKFAAIVKNS